MRRVLSSCFDCKRRLQPPDSQKMSDLPYERVNGTNLTSGEKELREAIGGWNKSKIGEFLLQKEVRWVLNPQRHLTWVGCGNE